MNAPIGGGLALVCAVIGAGPAAAAAQQPDAPALPPLLSDGVVAPGGDPLRRLQDPGDEVRLSNETTVTRWANAVNNAPVRPRPSGGARPIARLRLVGAAYAPEIYGVLRGRLDGRGRAWLQVRVPGRPNGRIGWAPVDAFGDMHVIRTQLVVNRSTLRATLYRDGRRVFQGPVGVGKASTPTPAGHFSIVRKAGGIFGPAYGPKVLFTNAYTVLASWPGGGAAGIHGTDQPGLVPGRPSHGCIRLHNGDITRLARLAPVGTPLRIR